MHQKFWLFPRSATVAAGFVLLYLMALRVQASADAELSELLARAEPPAGVVFEVVSGDEAALQKLMPKVKTYSERLRARFPGLEIAVVSHGSEQFSLLLSEASAYAGLHADIQALVGESDVPVHVCGGHASWRSNTAEDFPKYVDVAPSGPGQIRAYQALGYVLIVL